MASAGVLIVDDEPDVLSMLQGLLAAHLPQLAVHVSASPKEALQIVRDEQPRVIVADYRMHEMDGVRFLRLAKQLAPQARLIMLSGNPDRFASESSQDSYLMLAKPIQPDLFVKMVKTITRAR